MTIGFGFAPACRRLVSRHRSQGLRAVGWGGDRVQVGFCVLLGTNRGHPLTLQRDQRWVQSLDKWRVPLGACRK